RPRPGHRGCSGALGLLPGGLPADARRLLHGGAAARFGRSAVPAASALRLARSKRMDDSVLSWMPLAYLVTVGIETPVLLVGLSARHPYGRRLFAGLWLTACTYPLLWMVLPAFLDPTTQRAAYLAVGETFVAIGECALFWLAFGARESWGTRSAARDF